MDLEVGEKEEERTEKRKLKKGATRKKQKREKINHTKKHANQSVESKQ